MDLDSDITAIQACVANRLDAAVISQRQLAGVIGDAPSQYSKSPTLWNAAFHLLAMNAIYLPFDVEERRLKDFASAIRDSERTLGINVTVPHKLRIMDYLDELDPGAARIQAVNTIVREKNGRLVGYNTDGEGFAESILKLQPGHAQPFVASLKGMNVLLLGAGGSARALAFHITDLLNGGELMICNRTFEHAVSLAAEIRKFGADARAIPETELPTWAARVGLIVNCTTKGQGSVRKLADGKVTSMEPYSALAPASPVAVPRAEANGAEAELRRKLMQASRSEIESNNQASLTLAAAIPPTARFCDLIYFPEETVFLRHGRLTAHQTMNGKAMIVNQAVIAFCRRICRAELQARRIDNPQTYRRILEIMYRAW